jgi:flagellar motor switch protein FliG
MNAVTTSLDNAGVRKAAILVASLDPAAADALLDRLAPEQANLVRQAVMVLDEIETKERQRVLDEFRRIGPMVPDKSPPGIELDGAMSDIGPQSLAAPRDATNGRGFTSEASDAPPFEFLSDAEHERLAQLLRGERPPTIALVLSHLPPRRAGEVLACFPPALGVEVVRRLADIENTDAETVRNVEQALESRWARQAAIEAGPAVGGPEAMGKILAACDPQMRGRILANLADHDRPLAERFGHHEMAFDDVAQCDDPTILAILRAAEPETAQAALLGASPAVVERFLRAMPKKEAKRWRVKLDHPEPIRLSDVEEARRQIAALAQDITAGAMERTAA